MTSHTDHFRKHRPGGALLLATAITLTSVALATVWLLHDGNGSTLTARPAPQHISADGPRELVTGRKRGEPAELRAAQEAHGRVDAPDRGSRPVPAAGVSDQEAYARWQAGQPAGAETVYLVGSAEQADMLQSAIAELDAIHAGLGAPLLAATILAVNGGAVEHHGQALGEAEVLVVETEEDAAQVRAGLSRPGTTIIDLRASSAGATIACDTTVDPAQCN